MCNVRALPLLCMQIFWSAPKLCPFLPKPPKALPNTVNRSLNTVTLMEYPSCLFQGLVTFEDVSVRFTEEEWALLGHKEKTLYWDVMQENYDNVAWMSKCS